MVCFVYWALGKVERCRQRSRCAPFLHCSQSRRARKKFLRDEINSWWNWRSWCMIHIKMKIKAGEQKSVGFLPLSHIQVGPRPLWAGLGVASSWDGPPLQCTVALWHSRNSSNYTVALLWYILSTPRCGIIKIALITLWHCCGTKHCAVWQYNSSSSTEILWHCGAPLW